MFCLFCFWLVDCCWMSHWAYIDGINTSEIEGWNTLQQFWGQLLFSRLKLSPAGDLLCLHRQPLQQGKLACLFEIYTHKEIPFIFKSHKRRDISRVLSLWKTTSWHLSVSIPLLHGICKPFKTQKIENEFTDHRIAWISVQNKFSIPNFRRKKIFVIYFFFPPLNFLEQDPL